MSRRLWMESWRHASIAGLMLAWVAGVSATATGQFLTEEQVVQMAIRDNPQVKAAEARVSYAKAGVWEATSNMLPQASASYSKTRNEQEIAFSFEIPDPGIPGFEMPDFGEQVILPLESKSFAVDVTQPLFTGGALYQARRIASRSRDAADNDYRAVVQSVALQAREAYFNLIRAQGLLRIMEETLEQTRENKRVIDKMYEVGMVPKADVLRVDAALAQVEQGLQEAREGVGLARAQLNVVLNRDLEIPVTVDPDLDIAPFDRSLETCIRAAVEQRPDLRQVDAHVDIAKRSVKATMGSLVPSLAVVYHYEWSDQETAFAPQDSWRLMGVLSYDLPLGFGNVARVQGARAQAREAERSREQLVHGIELEVRAAWSALNVAKKGLQYAETQLASATENRRVIDRRYREGEATYLDLLNADTLLTQAKVNDLNTRIDYRTALASLRKAMGEEE